MPHDVMWHINKIYELIGYRDDGDEKDFIPLMQQIKELRDNITTTTIDWQGTLEEYQNAKNKNLITDDMVCHITDDNISLSDI